MRSYLPLRLASHLESSLLTNAVGGSVVMEGGSSKTLLQKALDFLPLINQVNIMYLLLILLCWEGNFEIYLNCKVRDLK